MDPFDWTKDKSVYHRWQLWSEKARLALDAMEGDSEKTKISYFHHWINGEGMGHIELWKNSKTLMSQSTYDELEKKEGRYSSETIESYFTLFEVTNQNELMERTRDRIILEHNDLQITVIHLENPQEWKGSV